MLDVHQFLEAVRRAGGQRMKCVDDLARARPVERLFHFTPDDLEYEYRPPIAALGESVTRLDKLSLEGGAGEVSQESTPEPASNWPGAPPEGWRSSPRSCAIWQRAASRGPSLMPAASQLTPSICTPLGADGGRGGPGATVGPPERTRSHTAFQRSFVIACYLSLSAKVQPTGVPTADHIIIRPGGIMTVMAVTFYVEAWRRFAEKWAT